MSDLRDVAPISSLAGMTVLSLSTGNKLGEIADLFIDPINGVLLGVELSLKGGGTAGLRQEDIYSFGRDAVMAKSDQSLAAVDSGMLEGGRDATELIGTKIITESGDLLGQITNVFITLKPPPRILYEARQSLLDKLLGREFFVPASLGHALSDDSARLVVPDITTEIVASDLAGFVEQEIVVHGRETVPGHGHLTAREDDTVPMLPDDDETLVRFGEDEDTVLRRPGPANS
jgi:uncharacterized protein YrrD